MSLRARFRLGFGLIILCLFVYAAIDASDFSRRARYMPLYVSIAGMILCACLLALDYWRIRTSGGQGDPFGTAATEEYAVGADTTVPGWEAARIKRMGYFLGWFGAYFLLIGAVGLPAASALFLAAFLRIEGRMSAVGIAISIGVTLTGLYGVTHFMHLHWPPNLAGL